jgi:hypothetical protein
VLLSNAMNSRRLTQSPRAAAVLPRFFAIQVANLPQKRLHSRDYFFPR